MKRIMIAVMAVVALAVVGCHKSPAYVGTYKLVINDTIKQMAQMADAFQKGSTHKVDMMDMYSKMTLTLTEDGKANMPDPTGGTKALNSTYTAEGNTITVKVSAQGGKDLVLTFDEKEQTLTMTQGAMSMVFKKQ